MTASSFPNRSNSGDEPDESDALNEHVREPGDPDGVIAAEQRQRWQERRPAPPPTPRAEPARKRRWLLGVLAVLLLVVALCGSYLLGSHEADKKQAKQKTQQTTAASQATTPADANVIKNYSSTNFGLSFNYPGDWVVKDTTKELTVTSPAMELVSAVGAKVKAHVIVTVQNQQSSVTAYPTGGAAAALNSDLLSYKQPSTDQVAQTYLSYLTYTAPNGLDAIYLTGSTGYQQGQAVPESDLTQVNPLISVGFESCKSTDCSTGSHDSVSLQASDWKSSTAGQQVTNLIESIVITD